MFGMPERGQCDYTTVLDVALDAVEPSVAGPKRPQDRIAGGYTIPSLDRQGDPRDPRPKPRVPSPAR